MEGFDARLGVCIFLKRVSKIFLFLMKTRRPNFGDVVAETNVDEKEDKKRSRVREEK
jgi:hypothetical protein